MAHPHILAIAPSDGQIARLHRVFVKQNESSTSDTVLESGIPFPLPREAVYAFVRRGDKAREMKVPSTDEFFNRIMGLEGRYFRLTSPVVFLGTDSPQVKHGFVDLRVGWFVCAYLSHSRVHCTTRCHSTEQCWRAIQNRRMDLAMTSRIRFV